ncbi:disease resistance protein RUN1-like [Vigna umbellata]|uniref:disease resistance protein RUN1-like n=1 Tax=Vigna umbellata TaxID=87088 RepID=UPI001F5F5351|nr:disease resistance protein RUN1-like [Vigna umbellata]
MDVASSLSIFSKFRVSGEVFIHCLGDDIHRNFVSHLSSSLLQAGVKPSVVAVEILSEKFMPSITRFQIGIVVFTTAYIESYRCVEDLLRIIECHENHGLIVMPVFYDIDPSDLFDLEMDSSYDIDPSDLLDLEMVSSYDDPSDLFDLEMDSSYVRDPIKGGFKKDSSKVYNLRSARRSVKTTVEGTQMEAERFNYPIILYTSAGSHALNRVANLPTWDESKHRNDAELVEEIVKSVLAKLDRALTVTKFPVELETQVKNVIGLFENQPNKVCMIGIWGMGGSGKTTLAKAIYNKIPFTFGDKSFILDIRKVCQTYGRRGLVQLQEQLLSDVLKYVKIGRGEIEKPTIENRLSGKKLFIVLDDVNEINQLKQLCGSGKWFRAGSVIIITTRHLDLLYQQKVDYVYEMDELNENDSVELFSWHAFREAKPRENFNKLARSAVAYCGGLPLALEVLGSYLSKRSENEWRSVLSKLEIIPNTQIQNILRISFDGLREKEKDIFLDVCCFFIGKDRGYVTEILNGCGLDADFGIKVLIKRGLLKIEKKNKLGMHHLLRDMGREIVRQTSTMQPGKRSRLWLPKDVLDVLTKNTGTEAIVGLSLNTKLTNSDSFKADAFKEMKTLRFLQLGHVRLTGDYGYLSKQLRCISWQGFSLEHIPNNFYLEGAIVMDFQHSNLRLLWKEPTVLPWLKILNLSHSKYLTETPDFSKLPSLEKLILKHCVSLGKVHQSIGDLHNLLLINLKGCTNLSNLPSETYKLKSLKTLILSGCLKIDIFKEDIMHMKSLKTLISHNTAVKQVPISVVSSKSIGYIQVDEGKGLSRTVLHSIILSWMSHTFNPLYHMRPFRGISPSLASMNVEHNDLVDLAPVLRSILNLRTVLVQCVTEYPILQQVTAILEEVRCVTWTTSTQLSNHPFSPYLIQIGGYQEEVFNTLRKSIYDEELAARQTRKVFVPSDNYPHWLAYKNEGHSAKFTVPDNFHMNGMILCVEHLSRLGDPTQYLSCVLMVNYTKCIIQLFNRETLTSLNDVDWQGVISHLGYGDKLEIFIIFEKGFEVQKTAVYLVCNDQLTESQCNEP